MAKPHETLKAKFGPQKRFTKLASVFKPCQLGFFELLVYSTLIFRERKSGYSAARLSLYTSLDRTKTVPRTLAVLSGYGLVTKSPDGRWRANLPPADISHWFCLREAEQVKNKFKYNWIGVPAANSPLTVLQAAIIPNMVLKTSWRKISRFLRVSLRTVSRTAQMIKDNDNVFLKDWFQDKGKVERKRKSEADKEQPKERKTIAVSELLGLTDSDLIEQIEKNSELMRADGIKDKNIVKWWRMVFDRCSTRNIEIDLLLLGFKAWFGRIQTDHKANFKNGLTSYANCYHLLQYTIDGYVR